MSEQQARLRRLCADNSVPTLISAHDRTRGNVQAVVTFLVVTFGAAWLITLPLWLSGLGLRTPGSGVILAAVTLAPTLGTLAVVGVLRRRPGTLRATGLTSARGVRSWLPWAVLAGRQPVLAVG